MEVTIKLDPEYVDTLQTMVKNGGSCIGLFCHKCPLSEYYSAKCGARPCGSYTPNHICYGLSGRTEEYRLAKLAYVKSLLSRMEIPKKTKKVILWK